MEDNAASGGRSSGASGGSPAICSSRALRPGLRWSMSGVVIADSVSTRRSVAARLMIANLHRAADLEADDDFFLAVVEDQRAVVDSHFGTATRQAELHAHRAAGAGVEQ